MWRTKGIKRCFPMFSRLHFVLNLLVRVLSRNLLSRGASAGDVSRSTSGCPGFDTAEPVTFVHRRQLSRKHVWAGSSGSENRGEAKCREEKLLSRRMRQQKLLLLLFISFSLFRFFHGLFTRTNGREDGEEEEMELEIVPGSKNSSEQSTKCPSTTKHGSRMQAFLEP